MRLTPMFTNSLKLVSLGVVMTFFGCAKPDETKPASSKNEPVQAAQATPANSGGLSSPGITSTPSTPAIASADGERAGTRVDVTELKRSSDNTLTLKFVMINDSDKGLGFSYDFGDRANNDIKDFASIGGVNLVDGAGKKKYFVVRDTENNCVCSRDLKDIPAHGRANLWAKFPAPPDNVQKISIVIPHFGPIDDAPISR